MSTRAQILITAGATALTERAGRPFAGTQEIGLVDYQNGILPITDSAVSYPGTKPVIFTPAAAPILALHTASWAVTPETRSSTVVTFVDPPPAQGKWYVLRAAGGGSLVGIDAAYGAGQVSYTTSSVLATLGALPDIGSRIIMTYGLATTEMRRDGVPLALP